VTRAVEHELQSLEREAVDAQFALMAEDEEFQAEALRITAEFTGSDWEALRDDEPGR
jgi:hypothetical protein